MVEGDVPAQAVDGDGIDTPPDSPEYAAKRAELLPMVSRYEEAMRTSLEAEGWSVENKRLPVLDSWKVITHFTAASGEKVGSLRVQFSPETFYLTLVGVEKKFRGQKISSRLYQLVASFLENERPGYRFSTNAVDNQTRHLSRTYFDILEERGNKFRGRVRAPKDNTAA